MSETSASFIHSKLDDYGLTPAEFRVFGHISRRGDCFAAVETMATVCRIEPKTVRKCLKFLESQGLISRQDMKGRASLFRCLPIEKWKAPLPNGTRGAKRVDTPTKRHQAPLPKSTSGPYQTAPVEGIPSNGSPSESSPSESGTANGHRHALSFLGRKYPSKSQGGGPHWSKWLKWAKRIGYKHVYGDCLEAYHAWCGKEAVGWMESEDKPIRNWRGFCRVCMNNTEGQDVIQEQEAIDRAFELQAISAAYSEVIDSLPIDEISTNPEAIAMKQKAEKANAEFDAITEGRWNPDYNPDNEVKPKEQAAVKRPQPANPRDPSYDAAW